MNTLKNLFFINCIVTILSYSLITSYSSYEDNRIIEEFKKQKRLGISKLSAPDLNHAEIARILVHQANWAAVGTISTNSLVNGFPMVNVVSVDDSDAFGVSTGKIRFLLTDTDFTGSDWKNNNRVTFLFSDEQKLNCYNRFEDPMEPTCARVIISGFVKMMDQTNLEYDEALIAFVQRHSAAKKWIRAHNFYLCELEIANIFVLDYYGGPHTVNAEEYYKINF